MTQRLATNGSDLVAAVRGDREADRMQLLESLSPDHLGVPFDLARPDASSLASAGAALMLVTLAGVAMHRHAGRQRSQFPGWATGDSLRAPRGAISHRLERCAELRGPGPRVSPGINRVPRASACRGSMAAVLSTRPRAVHRAAKPFAPPSSLCAARFHGLKPSYRS